MIKRLAFVSSPLLNLGVIRRIRRNHGLEHATIHLLSNRLKNISMAGRADSSGFYLYGNVNTEMVWEAVNEALYRMQEGEHKLAVHPNCGTGLVTTSVMTSTAAVVGLLGTRNRLIDIINRLPVVMLLSIGALVFSQPIGLAIQQHFTTSGEPGDLEIVDVTKHKSRLLLTGDMTVHRVQTRNG